MYIYINQKNPTDNQLANVIRAEWHLHKKKYLNMISDPVKSKAESMKFFKKICEELRKQYRPQENLKNFMSKMSRLIWDDIPDIQPIMDIKRFSKQETAKATARIKKIKDKRLGKTIESKPVVVQTKLF